jgi:hypothetical protein
LTSHYDRFFASQDTMPVGGFGNLIALTLQRKARDHGNSVFVDRHLRPYDDQWRFSRRCSEFQPIPPRKLWLIQKCAREHAAGFWWAIRDNPCRLCQSVRPGTLTAPENKFCTPLGSGLARLERSPRRFVVVSPLSSRCAFFEAGPFFARWCGAQRAADANPELIWIVVQKEV